MLSQTIPVSLMICTNRQELDGLLPITTSYASICRSIVHYLCLHPSSRDIWLPKNDRICRPILHKEVLLMTNIPYRDLHIWTCSIQITTRIVCRSNQPPMIGINRPLPHLIQLL